jgi:glycosyltransferase involved in cell wall biosynthesis
MQIQNLISIIIPIYNSEIYLSDCLESILNQSYKNLEIILINDGSTDNSAGICEAFSQKDIRIKALNTKNTGVSSARNLGLDIAIGNYVAFIDSDDTVHTDYILELYKTAELHQSDIVCCGYQFIDTTLNYANNDFLNLQNSRESFIVNLLHNTGGTICSKLFKRSVIKDSHLRFDTSLDMREDMIFAMEFGFCANSFSVINTNYYYYNGMNGMSLSKNNTTENRLQVFRIIKAILKQNNFNTIVMKSILNTKIKEILFAGVKELIYLDQPTQRIKWFLKNNEINALIPDLRILNLKEFILYFPVKIKSPLLTCFIYKIIYDRK